jgi:hypothetical protein
MAKKLKFEIIAVKNRDTESSEGVPGRTERPAASKKLRGKSGRQTGEQNRA